MTRLIDADALCEEFKKRQRAAMRWKERSILDDDEERKIRADAVLTFLSEVKLTIDNAPTVERPKGKWNVISLLNGYICIRCSECGQETRLVRDAKNEFCCIKDVRTKIIACPYCGADMKEGEDGL